MNVTNATYDEPAVWAPLLVEWAETCSTNCAEVAVSEREHRRLSEAQHYEDRAAEYRLIAQRAGQRLITATDNNLAEVNALTAQINDDPPSTLVALTGWIWKRLHRSFPWVNTTTWQEIGYLLLRGRP